MPDTPTLLLLAASAFAAGAINAVAGGGTLLTFPALLGVMSDAAANATSTVALLPGSLAGAWGYRAEVRAMRRTVLAFLPVSVLGGGVGAGLLVRYPEAFQALVPWLVLTAAVLFAVQPVVSKLLRRRAEKAALRRQQDPLSLTVSPEAGARGPENAAIVPEAGATGQGAAHVGVLAFQFGVAVYGGYFGAGIGILMLTALAFLNVGDIHRMNAVKTVLAAAINAVSALLFAASGLIDWRIAGVMAGASIVGGYVGARLARRVPAKYVRWTVAGIGFGLAGWYFVR